MHASKPAIRLDRDGVINRDRPDSVESVDELVLLPGAAEAVAALNGAGYTVMVFTNQSCVGRGRITAEQLEEIHRELERRLAEAGATIDAFYVCTHTPEQGCDCRKPAPGLLLRAAREQGLEPARTWAVGDDVRDVETARAAGYRPALVLTGKGQRVRAQVPDVPAFDDLAAFVHALLRGELT